MKKAVFAVLSAVLLAAGLMGCNTSPVLRDATGATYSQNRVIVSWLGAVDIECAMISDSANPLIMDMDPDYKAYDLVGKDGNTYLLLLRKEDNDFAAVLSSEGELLHGMLDSGLLPAYFGE